MAVRPYNKPMRLETTTGYLHRSYAESLADVGEPVELPSSRGWILQRRTPVLDLRDAMGCYPIFCCRQWQALGDDLDRLRDTLVAISLVTDPFGDYSVDLLQSLFDIAGPHKEHFVADLSRPLEQYTSARHRKYARKALQKIAVEVCDQPGTYLDEWVRLYDNLIDRHQISGMRRFSRESFARQLAVPGAVMFRAIEGNEALSLDLWYVQGDVAHAHLVGTSPRGYETHVSYALKLFILQYFADKVRWANLGGVPGTHRNPNSGLAAFKRGWSSETRTVFLCGKIFNESDYQELVRANHSEETDFFPPYRQREFS